MCVHRRLIFDCVHQAWLGISQLCEVQQAHCRDRTNQACRERWTHGFDTIRIQTKCAQCIKRQDGDRSRFKAVKDQIQVLKKQLKLIKGDTIKEEDWLNTDSAPQKDKKDATAGDDDASISSPEEKGNTKGEDDTPSSSPEDTPDSSDNGSQPREEVGSDIQYRPFGLSLKIAERKAIEAGDAKGAAVYGSMLDCMLEQRYGHGWVLTRKLQKNPPTSTAC